MRWTRVALTLAIVSACGRTVEEGEDSDATTTGGGGAGAGVPSTTALDPTPIGGSDGVGTAGSPGSEAGGAGGALLVSPPNPLDCQVDPDCTGVVEKGMTFDEEIQAEVHDLAVQYDGQMSVALAGYDAELDFGPPTSPLSAVGGWDAIVVSFTSEGSPVWAQLFGSVGDDRFRGLSFDPSGSLVAAGENISDTDSAATMTKLDATGAPEWQRVFDHAAGYKVAADYESIVVTGIFWDQAVYFDGTVLDAPLDGTQHVFAARFDVEGICTLAAGFASAVAFPAGVAIDSTGNIVVAGSFTDSIDFGEAGVKYSDGGNGLFVVKLGPSGDLLSFDTMSGTSLTLHSMTLDSEDNLLLAGVFDGSFGYGEETVEGNNAIFVAKLDTELARVWTRVFSSSHEAAAHDVAVDRWDNVLVAGSFRGKLDTPQQIGASDRDALVVKLDPDGSVVWVTPIGGPGEQSAQAVGSDGSGNVYAAGTFFDAIDFGSGASTGHGDASHFFLAKLLP